MRIVFIFGIFLSALVANQNMIGKKEMVDFFISGNLKEQIISELQVELNATIEAAKVELSREILQESEKNRKLYSAQMEHFAKELSNIKDEVDFLRELVVEANYQRNSNEDTVLQLTKRFDNIEKKTEELEKIAKKYDEKEPEIPENGQKF